jgi:4-alpha-glucanotransferase
MNQPAIAEGNWKWRLSGELMDRLLPEKMQEMAQRCGRIPEKRMQ